ncbi:MAG: hypothetical protein ACRD2U_09550 [Terriglobales bacterium]
MPKDWKELSEAASREQDPKRLMELVEELDKVLEQCEKAAKEKQQNPNENYSGEDSNLHSMPGMQAMTA